MAGAGPVALNGVSVSTLSCYGAHSLPIVCPLALFSSDSSAIKCDSPIVISPSNPPQHHPALLSSPATIRAACRRPSAEWHSYSPLPRRLPVPPLRCRWCCGCKWRQHCRHVLPAGRRPWLTRPPAVHVERTEYAPLALVLCVSPGCSTRYREHTLFVYPQTLCSRPPTSTHPLSASTHSPPQPNH